MTYRKFISDRDQYLEKIFTTLKLKVADETRWFFNSAIAHISTVFSNITTENKFTYGSASMEYLDDVIDYVAREFIQKCMAHIAPTIIAIEKFVYASEFEALARRIGEVGAQQVKPNTSFNTVLYQQEFLLSIRKTTDKMKQEIRRAHLLDEDPAPRIRALFPESKSIKRILRPIKEAEKDKKDKLNSVSLDFMYPEEWDVIIDMYKEDYIPIHRFRDENGRFVKVDNKVYAWEEEQRLNNEYLQSIKDPMTQAANDLGIKDFVWIAVIDSKTRPEHEAKDGLTSSEISAKLKDEWSDFEDKTIIAPGGFNCRCRSVPYTEDIPQEKGIDAQEFFEWISGP